MTRRLVVSLAALAAVSGLLRLAEPGRDSLISEAAAAAARRMEDARDTAVVAHGQADCVAGLRESFAGSREAAPWGAPRSLRCEVEGDEVRIVDESGAVVGGASLPRWTSLLPPLAAVILALGTRLLLPSLLAGVWLGAFLIDPGWDLGLVRLLLGTFWPVVSDQFNLSILLFTFALVGMVNVASRAAGNAGIAVAVGRLARSQRGACVATWGLGLIVFFDDYANTQVVGHTMRPLSDRFRIPREKLAFIVDSTAAPVSGLAVLSTWIGYEVGLIGASAAAAGIDADGYEVFFRMLPFRFYCLFALAFVLLNAWTRRDFGPMLAAERRAALGGGVSRPGSVLMADAQAHRVAPHEGIRPNAWVALAPVAAVVIAILAGIVGLGSAAPETREWLAEPGRDAFSLAYVRQCFSATDSFFALLTASLIGTVVAVVLALTRRTTVPEGGSAATPVPTAPRDVARAALGAAALGAAAIVATGGFVRDGAPLFSPGWWSVLAGGPAIETLGALTTVGLAAVAIVLLARMRRERLVGRPVYALSLGDAASAWLAGARSMLVAAGILILAWSIRRVCDGLGTDVYVVASMRGTLDPIYLPIGTFLAACGISFATGTSWGTMGILIPTVLPLAHALGGDALMVLSLAAVLDGAIFGDHCSPISDTTVLSSIASRCDHIDHVKTQIPYAALCMIAALGIGYLPAALGHHGWWSYAAAIAFLLAALFLAGRRTDAAGPAREADCGQTGWTG